MPELRLKYRDIDRAPYLFLMAHMAEKNYGLKLLIDKAEQGGPFPEYLKDGATDVLCENYWQLQNQRARGERWISVATAVCTLNEKLFVRPDVKSIDDLRGKKIAIRKTGPSQLIPQLWAQDNNLNLEAAIYDEKETGRWGSWKKVLDGTCACGFITNFYQDDPRGAGLKELDIEPYGFIGNVTLTTTEEIAAKRRADIQALVDAAFDASKLFREAPEAALEIFKKTGLKLRDYEGDELKKIFGILAGELSEYPVPTAVSIHNTRRMTLFNSQELATYNTLLMWDFGFARDAMNRRGIK
jgi:ABC-type nitrate/sulfonate/bicarbonate transport system substrate-binding protein